MRFSRRGEVDPFIVMDVVEAARVAEAAGRRISTWRSAGPARRHPPELDFNPLHGGRTLRFSQAQARPENVDGLARLQAFMAQR